MTSFQLTRLFLMKGMIVFLLAGMMSCKTQNLFSDKSVRSGAEKIDSAFIFNPNYQHKIRVDDKINISVWGQDEMSIGSVYGIYNSNEVYGKWLLVDADGNIEVPRIGTLKVTGMTVPQLKEFIRSSASEWIQKAIVDVKVMNKEITLLGEFRNPSVIHVDKDNNNLLEMVARAGGFEFYANIKKIKILRQDGPDVKIANIDLTASGNVAMNNIQLHPGDVIIAPSKKHKDFDKRISTIIPLASTATAAAILMGSF
ncbi:MAG: polysaccharide biosynthesis/export family protein [Saprospiraceae bacterium]|nr:polysaccharide biosynthesis/export family protein [Saprospiraceae bacterium]MBK8669221.1 polysaccharide biosynthesis/export family protein [Saprospiraceae bacterium]